MKAGVFCLVAVVALALLVEGSTPPNFLWNKCNCEEDSCYCCTTGFLKGGPVKGCIKATQNGNGLDVAANIANHDFGSVTVEGDGRACFDGSAMLNSTQVSACAYPRLSKVESGVTSTCLNVDVYSSSDNAVLKFSCVQNRNGQLTTNSTRI